MPERPDHTPSAASDPDGPEAFEGTLMDGLENEPPYPPREQAAARTFVCPGCGEEEFPDEAGVVTCDECGAHIETLEPLGLRRILPNYWSRLRGSVAAAIPPNDEAQS